MQERESQLSTRLSNKAALIVGGTSGIGKATARLFAAEGASVLFTGRDERAGQEIERTLGARAKFYKADASDPVAMKATIDKAVDSFGRLDILFNNAGRPWGGNVDTVTEEHFRKAIDLLLGSVVFGMRYAAPVMKRQGAGAIINNASIAARRANLGGYLYSIAKAAVVQATKLAGVELAPFGITVNSVSPGAIATPIFLGGSSKAAKMPTDQLEAQMFEVASKLAKATPRQAAGSPEDIAAAVLFLASSEARHITCHDLVVDGGMLAIWR
jgi:NAD(P)-dependent dehydrogenase (short-subunit alcohol dehydrogenase family)